MGQGDTNGKVECSSHYGNPKGANCTKCGIRSGIFELPAERFFELWTTSQENTFEMDLLYLDQSMAPSLTRTTRVVPAEYLDVNLCESSLDKGWLVFNLDLFCLISGAGEGS